MGTEEVEPPADSECSTQLAQVVLREVGLATQPGYFFDMEREAFFTASLILEPHELARGAGAYAAYFDRLLNT